MYLWDRNIPKKFTCNLKTKESARRSCNCSHNDFQAMHGYSTRRIFLQSGGPSHNNSSAKRKFFSTPDHFVIVRYLCTGFKLVYETKARSSGVNSREKFGWKSCRLGDSISFAFSASFLGVAAAGTVTIKLAYLESYKRFGSASVSCDRGCSCPGHLEVSAHTSSKHQVLTVL